MHANGTARLDYSDSFNSDLCAELMSAIEAGLGQAPGALAGRSGANPQATLRQVMRVIAVESGFDVRCVASVSGCTRMAVATAATALKNRIERQKRGVWKRDRQPIEPVLAKAREAAHAWLANGKAIINGRK
jgi:hypothetical protein